MATPWLACSSASRRSITPTPTRPPFCNSGSAPTPPSLSASLSRCTTGLLLRPFQNASRADKRPGIKNDRPHGRTSPPPHHGPSGPASPSEAEGRPHPLTPLLRKERGNHKEVGCVRRTPVF